MVVEYRIDNIRDLLYVKEKYLVHDINGYYSYAFDTLKRANATAYTILKAEYSDRKNRDSFGYVGIIYIPQAKKAVRTKTDIDIREVGWYCGNPAYIIGSKVMRMYADGRTKSVYWA